MYKKDIRDIYCQKDERKVGYTRTGTHFKKFICNTFLVPYLKTAHT